MKVRMKVYAQFHEAFGFSWIVTDIDATYTLGDMARRRQEIVAQLKKEGVFDLQRELELPRFCQRIAVISSESAAGYGDFYNQLKASKFNFYSEIFPASMQGEQIESSVIAAMNKIYERIDAFDCVVIIRGGGATSDMSGFDTLALAENVAQFPLPIITGIGHDRDECVLDMVSHLRVKTPTAAAAFLIDHLQQVLDRIEICQERISRAAQARLTTLNSQLSTFSTRIPPLFSLVKTRHEARLDSVQQRLSAASLRNIDKARTAMEQLATLLLPLVPHLLDRQRHRLELLQQRTVSLDPKLLLKRGYSITLHNGKAIHDAKELKAGDEIETRLEQGTIKSVVK